MKIGFVGLRGVPARYGGSETATEEFGVRLVERGHEVVVFCRKHKSEIDDEMYRGIRRVVLPSIPTKALDTLSHTALSVLNEHARDCDVIHMIGMGNALLIPLLRARSRAAVVTTIDGFDWRRDKWGAVARLALRGGLQTAFWLSDEILIDAKTAKSEFEQTFGRETHYAPYGAYADSVSTTTAVEQEGLVPRGYFLFVGRMIPDKGVHFLIPAFRRLQTDKRLVIVGGTDYSSEYEQALKKLANGDPRIVFLGPRYGQDYRELCSNAFAYVQPSLVEGTSPQLLSALGFGRPVVASGIPTILETVDDAALTFEPGNIDGLSTQLQRLLDDPALCEELAARGPRRIREHYSWDRITDLVEDVSIRAHERRLSLKR